MILPDLNLLVYAYNRDIPQHRQAKAWWEAALSGTETVGIPWAVCLGFLRLVTNRRVMEQPWPPEHALQVIRSWLERAQVQILQPGPRHLDILEGFAAGKLLSSNLSTDAHLAALAVEFQAVVHSNDADFDRFPGVRRVNPLA